MSKTNLHITVGSLPVIMSSKEVDLESERGLIKSSLLYADKVRLCSLPASILLRLGSVTEWSVQERLDLLLRVRPPSMPPEVLALITRYHGTLKRIKAKQEISIADAKVFTQIEMQMDRLWVDLLPVWEEMAAQHKADEIHQAVHAGVLDVAHMSSDNYHNLCVQMYANLFHALTNPKTFPIFDAASAKLVRAAIADGAYVPPSLPRNKMECAFAVNFLNELPLDRVSIGEVLDIRRTLERPLINFRQEVIKFSEAVETTPWDEHFEHHANSLYRAQVEPAVMAVEVALRENGILKTLGANVLKRGWAAGGTSMLIMAAKFAPISQSAMAATATAVGAAVWVWDAYHEWRKSQTSIESNGLYFVQKVKEKLKDKPQRRKH